MLFSRIVFTFLKFIFLSTVFLNIEISARQETHNRPKLTVGSISYELVHALDFERGVQTYEGKFTKKDGSEQEVVVRTELFNKRYRKQMKLDIEHNILNKLASDDDFQKEIAFGQRRSHTTLVLEKPRGIALEEFDLKEKSFFCPNEVIFAMGAEMLKRLKYIHGKGILHRNINPESINIYGESVILSDFRLAIFMNEKNSGSAEEVVVKKSLMQFQSADTLANGKPSIYDDLESFFYTLLYFYNGGVLPWSQFNGSRNKLLRWHKKARKSELWNRMYFPEEMTPMCPFNFAPFARAFIFEKNIEDPFDYDKWIDIFEDDAWQNTIDKFWVKNLISGRYEVGKEILYEDEFTECKIYKGKDNEGKRDVMVKVKITKDSPDVYIMMFEYLAYRKLKTTNNKLEGFLNIYCYTAFKEHNTMVFEAVDKRLDQYVGDSDLTDGKINRIARQMIQRMKYVHSCGIVHRNIRPESFFFIKSVLHLMDFGISDDLDDQEYYAAFFTDQDLFKTSPAFKSLHVLEGGQPTKRDDMIAIGYVLLYINGKLSWIKSEESRIIVLQRKAFEKLERLDFKSLPPTLAYLKYVTDKKVPEEKIDYETAMKFFSSQRPKYT